MTKDTNESKISVTKTMQQALNTWEGCICATGGAIVPSKSFWYLIGFKWKEGVWTYKNDLEAPATLTVRDCNGIPATLKHLPLDEA